MVTINKQVFPDAGHSIKWFSIPQPVKMVTSWLEHFDFVAGDRYGGLVATVGGFGIV